MKALSLRRKEIQMTSEEATYLTQNKKSYWLETEQSLVVR